MSNAKHPSFTLTEFAAHGVLVSPRWYHETQLRQQLTGRWRINGKGYVVRSDRRGQSVETTYLHRLIKGLARGDRRQPDHENRNRLDNRDENLILVTPAQNNRNRSSTVRGLSYERSRGKWVFRPPVGGRPNLGRFRDKTEAEKRGFCFWGHGRGCECWKRTRAGAEMSKAIISPIPTPARLPSTPHQRPPSQPLQPRHYTDKEVELLVQARRRGYRIPFPLPPEVEARVAQAEQREREREAKEREARLEETRRIIAEQEREKRELQEHLARCIAEEAARTRANPPPFVPPSASPSQPSLADADAPTNVLRFRRAVP